MADTPHVQTEPSEQMSRFAGPTGARHQGAHAVCGQDGESGVLGDERDP